MLITHPPSHDWFCSSGVGNPKEGILLTNDQFSISLLLMIQILWISVFFALPLRIKALRRENVCWRKDSKKPRCWPGLFTVLGRDNLFITCGRSSLRTVRTKATTLWKVHPSLHSPTGMDVCLTCRSRPRTTEAQWLADGLSRVTYVCNKCGKCVQGCCNSYESIEITAVVWSDQWQWQG